MVDRKGVIEMEKKFTPEELAELKKIVCDNYQSDPPKARAAAAKLKSEISRLEKVLKDFALPLEVRVQAFNELRELDKDHELIEEGL
jgi:hypothetical protein